MPPMKRIRVEVLDLKPLQMADIAGVSQATVSKWDHGRHLPDVRSLARLRSYAKEKGIAWDDDAVFRSLRDYNPVKSASRVNKNSNKPKLVPVSGYSAALPAGEG